MEKIRVYELAKDLNTTSKRLMEKLAEINIVVKNHMSLLEDHELDALYKHIGIISHDDGKKNDADGKKVNPPSQSKPDQKKDVKKDGKSAPRIIRTTEIFIDSKNQTNAENVPVKQETSRNDFKGNNRPSNRQEFVRRTDSNSGLRPGFTRDTGVDLKNYLNQPNKPVQQKEPYKSETKPEDKQDVAIETKQDLKQEVKHEIYHETADAQQSDIKNVDKDEKKEVINVAEQVKPKHEQEKQETLKETNINATDAVDLNKQPDAADNEKTAYKHHDNKNINAQFSGRNEGEYQQFNRQADRPQFSNRHSDKPQYNARPQGDRPQYNNRPAGDRPQYNRQAGDRPAGDRPQYNRQAGDRPAGDRPQYNRQAGDRPAGDRPQYNRQGDRPQFGNNRGPGDRPQGGNFGNRQGGRFGDGRPQGGQRSLNKPLEIPKPDLSVAQKEEENSRLNETRREFQNKDVDKVAKREQKREVPKGLAAGKGEKFAPHKVVLGQKKGVSEALSEDYILDEFYSDEIGVKTKKSAKPRKDGKSDVPAKHIPQRAVLTQITIPETVSVKDLAEALKKTSTEVIKKLMGLGIMAALNQELDFDTAAIISEEFGVKAEKEVVVNEEDILFDDTDDADGDLQPRPPVVVVMGHVDHGKTSLLDAIRETNVTESEAGGITQHIGAYMVKINNRNITFLDTPGHEAFTAMRARGAQVTDIAILVVAADDGVMPQTIEAINHAKAANLSIIVAINKIDKPGANPERVKQELTEHGIVAEEWGGDAIMVPVSAKKRENIDSLLEMVLLAADMLELKADPNKQAKGTVIEAKLDKGRGPVATVLVQRGTLKTGDSIVTGTTVGRIRAMNDYKGNSIKKADPSTPVEILGMPEVPEAGEIFYAITDERVAKQLAEKRKFKQREQQLKASAKVSLEDLFNQIKEGKVKDLNIIVKADVQGSVEAVKQSLEKLSNDEVRVKIIHGGVGAITESDVKLAEVSNAIIIGFNVRPGTNVAEAAENAGVELKLYRVIYNAIEDIQAAMKGMLEPTFKEVILGHVEIRQIFKVSGVGTIGGCYVTDGKISRNSDVRVVRDGIVIHEGKLASLKRFKDDAKEVAQGFECGLSIERFNDIKEGDIIEVYTMEEVKR